MTMLPRKTSRKPRNNSPLSEINTETLLKTSRLKSELNYITGSTRDSSEKKMLPLRKLKESLTLNSYLRNLNSKQFPNKLD